MVNMDFIMRWGQFSTQMEKEVSRILISSRVCKYSKDGVGSNG